MTRDDYNTKQAAYMALSVALRAAPNGKYQQELIKRCNEMERAGFSYQAIAAAMCI